MNYLKWHKQDNVHLLLVAPQIIRKRIFEEFNCQKYSGHLLGRDRVCKFVQERFYWIGIDSDVGRWCKECDNCARGKPGPGFTKSPLQQSLVGWPLDKIGIDIVGRCPITDNGNEYIIVLSDYFSKWVEAYAVPNHTTLTVADKIVTVFFCRFGTTKQIHSDQGREFESEIFKCICERLEIKKTRSCSYGINFLV